MGPRPEAGASSLSTPPPKAKKAKLAGDQTSRGTFLAPSSSSSSSPSKKAKKGRKRAAENDHEVISILSSASEGEDGLEEVGAGGSTGGSAQPRASTSTSPGKQARTRTVAPPRSTSDVIDLDAVEIPPPPPQQQHGRSKRSIDGSTKAAAPVHPMFSQQQAKTPKKGSNAAAASSIDLSLDEDPDADAKPILGVGGSSTTPSNSNVKGKGRASGSSPSKLIIPTLPEGSDPVSYPLDSDIFEFDPERDVSTETWPRNAGTGRLQIPYSFLVAAFVLVSATRARLTITTILTNTLRTVVQYQPEVLRETIYLITNHVAPAYEGVELGIGGQVLGKALKAVSGTTGRDLKQLWNQHGDFGDVAFAAKSKVRTLFASQPLTISTLYNNLVTLTGLKGSGTVNKKADIVQRMLVAAKGEEIRFLVRTLVAHLRIGAVRLTVTASLARAFCLIPRSKSEGDDKNDFYISKEERFGIKAVAKTAKEGKDDPRRLRVMQRLQKAESLVREVYVRHPNYDSIVPALLSVGLQGLSDAIPLSVGTPLSPMLGQITRDLGDVATRLEPTREFAAEWKYDGQRVQIHCERREKGKAPPGESQISTKKGGGQWVGKDVYVRLFSRHLEDMTAKYPDILQLMPELLSPVVTNEDGSDSGVQSFIIDAEIVAIDPITKALLTFQILANRARKDVSIHEVKVKVGVFAFDLMYLNGQTLINKPFRERRNLLKTRFPPREPSEPTIARFDHVKCMEGFPNNLEPIRQFMLQAISEKCEGLMLKLLDSAPRGTAEEENTGTEGVTGRDDDREVEIEDEDVNEEDVDELADDVVDGPEGQDDATEEDGSSFKKKGRRKALLATYEPDKRVESWVSKTSSSGRRTTEAILISVLQLKVKRDYGDLGDSLDVVPIGAWHGQGRKTGWWSPILLAVYDPETGGFQALCKCISGFTDAFYKELNERYPKGSETCSSTLKTYVDSGLRPDVWWQPSEVWEIRGADLTLSPVYTAALGLVSAERGLSLRFPRFIKVRADKSIEQATTPEDLAAAWHRQSDGHKTQKPEKDDASKADEAFEGFE